MMVRLKFFLIEKWRAELQSVAKDGDELSLGVKSESNLEIAGFLRNLLQ